MRAYKVARMRVSKPCYINMYRNIDEPFQFNASLRHIIVNLVLIVNTLVNSYYSLSFPRYVPLLTLFFILKLVPSFGLDCLLPNRNTYLSSVLRDRLQGECVAWNRHVVIATVSVWLQPFPNTRLTYVTTVDTDLRA